MAIPIDVTPSNVATSALQNLPFNNLIGGPLNAAIQAQAQSAQTTVDFIKAVCLNTDSNGNMSAVTVTFSYTDGFGLARTLTVPIITILPIPYIAITEIDIAFKANINASSATSTTDTSSESLSAGGSASARIGWGIFSANIQFNAAYSSKKDSTATADSKYSVEYTMDVSVKAGSADMPGGLAKVLNILSDGITMKTSASAGSLQLPAGTIASGGTTSDKLYGYLFDSSKAPITGAALVVQDPQGLLSAQAISEVSDAPGVYTGTITFKAAPTQTPMAFTVVATLADKSTVTGQLQVSITPKS